MHAYTITHAIDDGNVLRFHIDYYKPEGERPPSPGEAVKKEKIIETILTKHDAATANRKFNALLATSRINDAIEYFDKFKAIQARKQAENPDFQPLNIACVFSPPAEGNNDEQQIQEDLPQEKADNKEAPEEKKGALRAIIADYNQRFRTNHSIGEFDLYYQDVQKRIKDQQIRNEDFRKVDPEQKHAHKIDLTIVVDMLLTGFDSKYLNTLYVDKNLKHHTLIQALSRTNRVLNDTKPYGNILDFRQQQQAVEDAITLFSGEKIDHAREIWLVEPAPKVIEKLQGAVENLGHFMKSQGLSNKPEDVPKLRGDAARSLFVNLFKEVQRFKTQLEQYTDLSSEEEAQILQVVPPDQLRSFRSAYLETAQRLKEKQDRQRDAASPEVQQLDFEFVLFASAVIDYDYIMELIARYTHQKPGKQRISREQLIGLIESDAKFLDEREAITNYVRSLEEGKPLDEKAVREGYQRFKAERDTAELAAVALKHSLSAESLQHFVEGIIGRMIFDGEQLVDLLAPLQLGWRDRTRKELALMGDLVPLLKKRAGDREISGLNAYEQ